MQLPLIDFFEKGAQTIYTSLRMPLGNLNRPWLPSNPVVVRNHLDLADLSIFYEERVAAFVDAFLTPVVIGPWRKPMGSRIPSAISRYQKKNQWSPAVDSAIHRIGATLSAGQKLYRGGLTVPGVQKAPLSTTLSPAVAFHKAIWGGNALAQGKLYLYVLSVSGPMTNVYVFRQRGSCLAYEKEVLFASGAIVKIGQPAKTGIMPTGLPYEIIEATIQ